ncbi:MAG: Zn-ribbon domain-containing OB-fold protein [Acidimicrobiales bacterium]
MTADATMTTPTTAPVAAGLFTWPSDEPQLIGGACHACGAVAFPRPPSCSRCTSEEVEEHLLSRAGRLWSWTVQRFQPKEPFLGPEPFVPYGVGYVDLAGEVLVEARLTTADPVQLEIGQPVQLVIVPFAATDDGTELLTFAFRPSTGEVVQP